MKTLGGFDQNLGINTRMLREHEINLYNINMKCYIEKVLKELYLISQGDSRVKTIIRKQLNLKKGDDFFSKDTIDTLYSIIAQKLKIRETEAFIKTQSEINIASRIKKATKKIFFTSVLIGNSVVDIFFPQYKLAIEVNGPIHHNEVKMRKDCHRDQELIEKLGICITDVYNDDINKSVHNIIHHLKTTPPNPHARTQLLLRNIKLMTIAKQMSVIELSNYLRINFRKLIYEIHQS